MNPIFIVGTADLPPTLKTLSDPERTMEEECKKEIYRPENKRLDKLKFSKNYV